MSGGDATPLLEFGEEALHSAVVSGDFMSERTGMDRKVRENRRRSSMALIGNGYF